jgi:uncharacterized protein
MDDEMKRAWGLALLLGAGSWSAAALAEVKVSVPAPFQLLAVQEGKLLDEHSATVKEGVAQLLVRYDGVEESRTSSDNDTHHISQPQVVRIELHSGQLLLLPEVATAGLSSGEQMAAFAKEPTLDLRDGQGQPVAFTQDELASKGLQLGIDWSERLADYNRDGGAAALALVIPALAAGGEQAGKPQSQGATGLEAQLQQLFLQADPALRKRFIGWAVPQL